MPSVSYILYMAVLLRLGHGSGPLLSRNPDAVVRWLARLLGKYFKYRRYILSIHYIVRTSSPTTTFCPALDTSTFGIHVHRWRWKGKEVVFFPFFSLGKFVLLSCFFSLSFFFGRPGQSKQCSTCQGQKVRIASPWRVFPWDRRLMDKQWWFDSVTSPCQTTLVMKGCQESGSTTHTMSRATRGRMACRWFGSNPATVRAPRMEVGPSHWIRARVKCRLRRDRKVSIVNTESWGIIIKLIIYTYIQVARRVPASTLAFSMSRWTRRDKGDRGKVRCTLHPWSAVWYVLYLQRICWVEIPSQRLLARLGSRVT